MPGTNRLIGLDPGHGGDKTRGDPGAVDPVQPAEGDTLYTEEDDLTFAAVERVAALLKGRGYQVAVTRGKDQPADLAARTDLLNARRCDVAVSVHFNAAVNTAARGFESFHFPGSTFGARLATAINDALAAAFPDHPNRGVKAANFHMLRETNMPSALVELGFLTNPAEEREVVSPAFLNQAAGAIAAGVEKYFEGRARG